MAPGKKRLLLNRNSNFKSLKKLAAIFLLSLLLFNLIGYRWVFSIAEQNASTRLDNKITSGEYNEEQLVEIQIPLNMPYCPDKDYENISGEMEWNGNHYQYVKRKVSDNILYLLCLPDIEKTNLSALKNEFTKAVNDIPANKQGSHQKNGFIKLLTTEYKKSDSWLVANHNSSLSFSYFNKDLTETILFYPATKGEPPEII